MGKRLEAVVLTGGASQRMGQDKSQLRVSGQSLADRIASEFDKLDVLVTVLGREQLPGRAFVADSDACAGPAVALSRFKPSADIVFVASCDMPRFKADLVVPIAESIGNCEAAIPRISERDQYLCAAYLASVFDEWKYLVETGGKRSMRELVRVLNCTSVDERALRELRLDPSWIASANTPEELEEILREKHE